MFEIVRRIIRTLDFYEGRDAFITLVLYFSCLFAGYFPDESKIHQSLRRISKRFEDCRVVLRLFDDLTILRDFFTYELRPGERNRFVRLLKLIHYVSWLVYYPSEHLVWLNEMQMLDIDDDFWQFSTNCSWSIALGTSALWNFYVVYQYLVEPKPKEKNDDDKEKKSKIPWISARNAVLAVLRDGSEFIVAVHCLPSGYLWSSNLTLIQYGLFGTCSALIRLLILFKFQN